MEIIKDVLGKTPKLEDIVVWNPAKYKGLVFGTIVGFRKQNGLPVVKPDKSFDGVWIGQCDSKGFISPKTGFVVV